ncbi:RNA polymerase sigma factor [Pedobacter rhodius]|uniref:RNA polymerase sigma-70 factor n=1 Tax=Pedobacter rhodius TaxID=3004098 RepID=A0ABT4KUD4_9SPHI|nr:RNA polymerase sigma-70 factor [Pedobacter sp. SJ11]MCZ4222548.1 RNA polymerase sigma-70 factor [Pedobacter sp. SJ11]
MAIAPLHNEQELLAKIARGDERAFTELFEGYYGALGEFVFKLTESLPVTQEIVQDAFIKIWLKRESLTELKSFSNYLFIICRNQTYNHLRKIAGERNLQQQVNQYLNENNELQDDDVAIDQYRLLIDQAIDKLPEKAKKVYLLSRHERLKYDEIAQKLNISPETVKKHIQYAVNFIKNDINSRMDIGIAVILMSSMVIR